MCVLLGRMLGDIGPYWTLLLGAILLWVAMDMLGIAKCRMPGNSLQRLQVRGLTYGVLSGSCTFGFIAPILAIITVQKQIAAGLFLLTLFALGHCLPIAVAGSSATTVKRILNSSSFYHSGTWFRKGAGVLVGSLGVYFILRPWISV